MCFFGHFQYIAENCCRLRVLEIDGSVGVDVEVLLSTFVQCHELREVDFCQRSLTVPNRRFVHTNLVKPVVQHRLRRQSRPEVFNVDKLKLTGNKTLSNVSLVYLATKCINLSRLIIDRPDMQHISTLSARSLPFLQNLSEIDIRALISIEDNALKCILRRCPVYKLRVNNHFLSSRCFVYILYFRPSLVFLILKGAKIFVLCFCFIIHCNFTTCDLKCYV